ncbi:MAG TPA: hypothetical protein DEQ80_07990 [Anaerolinea thermolimosa]|uniref:Uncharacterized protein n=1 Tax=Anaerolinea thermolimosa TaxID=229919 RepID=A0A3D1JH57_9CHLR|nr:hypothetical protein [Anaerolinea thermolimosa]
MGRFVDSGLLNHGVSRCFKDHATSGGAKWLSLTKRWEFGTADEHPFLQERYAEFIDSHQKDDGLLILKRFFEASKYRLVEKIQEQLAKLHVKVISYGQIFGNPKHLLDFTELLENSTIPSKDLEIVFAALSQNCTIFITDDGKKRKGIFQGFQTLGLEYTTECVSIENFVSGRYFSKP